MTIKFDAEAAALRYRDSDLEDLVRIVYVQPENFVPEAIELAKNELQRRGVNGAEHPEALSASEVTRTKLAANADAANRPANAALLVLCFIFADLLAVAAALIYSANGREKAATQVWKAFGYGWLLRIVLIGLLVMPWGRF